MEAAKKTGADKTKGKQRKETGTEMDQGQSLRRGSSPLLFSFLLISWRARDGGVVGDDDGCELDGGGWMLPS